MGVFAWGFCSASLPLSVENKGKGHGKENTQWFKVPNHSETTRLLASLLQGTLRVVLACSAPPTPPSALLSGSALPLPLRNRQPLTIKHARTSTKVPLPHAISRSPRLYSYLSSMHPALSRSSPLISHETANSMHRLRLSYSNTSTSSCSLWTLARPVVIGQLLLRMHRSASTTNVARKVARRLPHSHAVALLNHRHTSPFAPPLSHDHLLYVSSSCPAKRKIQKQRNNKGNSPPLTLSLARCGAAVWS